VFTARYELGLLINRLRFVVKGLMHIMAISTNERSRWSDCSLLEINSSVALTAVKLEFSKQ
jgi:hypothetical protein